MISRIIPRPKDLNVTGDDPFAEDALARKQPAEILTQFVSRLSDPYVIAIDSPWGTGKTTFIQMWQAHLRKQGFETLSFNAWESDFADDPFTALVGELSSHLNSIQTDNSKKLQKAMKRTRKAAISIAKRAIPVAAKLATAGILDIDKALEDSLGSIAEGIAKDALDSYTADKDALVEFRSALREAAEALRTGVSDPRPIIFIIDELDRCRPTYALALLERAKHLFSVPGIVFVLAIDRNQLENSVKYVYGPGIDSAAYLRRFIDIEYKLPTPNMASFAEMLWEKLDVDKLLSSHSSAKGFDRRSRVDSQGFLKVLVASLCELTEMSLREEIQCISRLSIVIRTIPHDTKLYDVQLGVLCILREWDPKLFSQLEYDPGKGHEVRSALGALPGGPAFFDSLSGHFTEAALTLGAAYHRRDRAFLGIDREESDSVDPRDPEALRRSKVDSCVTTLQQEGADEALPETFKRINMASGFFSEDYEPKEPMQVDDGAKK